MSRVFAIFMFALVLCSCGNSKPRQAEALVIAIEQFRSKQGRVPTPEEIPAVYESAGVEYSEACPCYEYLNESEYKVYWGTVLGESEYIDSGTTHRRVRD